MHRSVVRLGLACLLVTGACARESTLLPAACASAGDCEEGASCLSGLCLPADGDFDGDGVTNAVEASLGSDLLRADSDGDGFPDGFEISDGAAPDLDGDGRPNVVERAEGDADRDCIPDDRDPNDQVAETDEINLRRECRFYGACTNTFMRQQARCEGGVLTCTFDGQPYPEESCGNEIDDDCDGKVDEGCNGGDLSAGPFVQPYAAPGDVAGTLVIEKPFRLVVPTQGPLPDALRTLELDWVTEIEARCLSREEGLRPPQLTFRIDDAPTGGVGLADARLGATRDARGRPTQLTASGRLSGSVALEHLAGRPALLTLSCADPAALADFMNPSVTLPVRVKGESPDGDALAPRTAPADEGCASFGAGPLALLSLLLLLRRRGAATLVLAAAGCSSGLPAAEVLWEGAGVENARPLWPFGGEEVVTTGALDTSVPHVPLAQGLARHSQRRVANGVEHRFDRGFSPDRQTGMAFLISDDGDVYLTASHYGPVDPPMLLVPRTVRVGLTWEVERALETDTLRHWIGLPLEYGDGRFRLTVSHRQVVHTRWGEQILWRIEWAGPPMPHALDPGGNVWTRTTGDEYPPSERDRLRGAFDFVEGGGPVSLQPFLHALDAFAHFDDGELAPMGDSEPSADGASRFAERAFPPLPADDAQLAGAIPQEAPVLEPKAAADNPVLPEGLYPQAIQITRSSKEAQGELVLYGLVAGRSPFIDPDGNTVGVFFANPGFACGRVDDEGRAAGSTDLCPQRIKNGAQPWVHPDGRRWDTPSIGKVLGELQNLPPVSRPPVNEWPSGFEPVAPLWMDDAFQVLGTLGSGGVLQLRAFGEEPETDLLDWPREASDRIPGRERFSLSGYVGGDTDQPLSFALPFENGLAFVRPTSVLWLSREGKPLKQQPLVSTRYGWSHRDGAHVRTEVGQLGELRRLHVEEDGVWAELLGRIELPAGHVAGLAVHLSGSRYLVFTQQEPEMRLTGFTDERITDEGLEQLPPGNGPLHAFVVEAPPTKLVDRDWMLRQVYASVGEGVVRVCVPAGSDWRIDGMRVGHVALSSFVSRDPGCWDAPYDAGTARRTQAAGRTPLWVHVEGQGWIRRSLRPLAEPPDSPPSMVSFATLTDGSRLYPDQWVAPLGVDMLPTPTRFPETRLTLQGMAVVADLSGAGLWVPGTTNTPANVCEGEPCIDPPYAPASREGLVPYLLADRTRHRTFWAPPGAVQAASTGGLLGPGVYLAPDGTWSAIPSHDVDRLRPFESIDWRFVDGTVCGKLRPPSATEYACLDAAGVRRGLDLRYADRAAHLAQEPGFLVRAFVDDGAFTLEVIDVRTMDRRRFDIAPLPEGTQWTVLAGADGTHWFLLGGEVRLLVGVREGRIERHPMPAGAGWPWSLTADTLLWASGRTDPRPTPSTASCVTLSERCNAIDDDCDGAIDEGEALCAAPNGTRACVAGRCQAVTCHDGFADCNEDPADGCEAALGTIDACTGCGDVCRTGALCTASGCGLPPPAELAAGEGFLCARNALGEVHCLGGPWPVTGPPDYSGRWTNPANDVAQVVAGAGHACVRRHDGTVACWGQTDVALGPAGSYFAIRDSPVTITGLSQVTRLWAGGRSTCAQREDESLWCWGPVVRNLVTPAEASEQAEYEALRVPTRVTGWDGARSLALSGNEACGVRADGSLGCFGPGAAGGSTFETRTFTSLPEADTVWGASGTYAGAGLFAFVKDGEVHGLGAWHPITALGGPAAGPSVEPARMTALSEVTGAAVGPAHACFFTATETLCAGANETGQLGASETSGVHPGAVLHPAFVAGVATRDSTCFAGSDGGITCMGKALEMNGRIPRWQPRRLGFWANP